MIIYKVINIKNNKLYIGMTTKTLKYRKNTHLNSMKCGSNYIFHNAIRKYGIDNFEWEIICECFSKEELNEKEIYYIKEFNTLTPNGYNISTGGSGGDMFTDNPNKEKIRQKYIDNAKYGEKNVRCGKYKITFPDGNIKIVEGLKQFCRKNNLNYNSVKTYLRNNKSYKGYTLEIIDDKYCGDNNSFYKKEPWNKGKKISHMLNSGKEYNIKLPDDSIIKIKGLFKFCKEYNINYNYFRKMIKLDREYKGYKVIKV